MNSPDIQQAESVPPTPHAHTIIGLKSPRVKLSVPMAQPLPRALTEPEVRVVLKVGDVLIPRDGENPAFSELVDCLPLLDTAVAALSETFPLLVEGVAGVADLDSSADLLTALRRLERDKPDQFFALTACICGAYFMSPTVRLLIGVPALEPHPPSISAAADDLEDGILDPVIERGFSFRPTDDCPLPEP